MDVSYELLIEEAKKAIEDHIEHTAQLEREMNRARLVHELAVVTSEDYPKTTRDAYDKASKAHLTASADLSSMINQLQRLAAEGARGAKTK